MLYILFIDWMHWQLVVIVGIFLALIHPKFGLAGEDNFETTLSSCELIMQNKYDEYFN